MGEKQEAQSDRDSWFSGLRRWASRVEALGWLQIARVHLEPEVGKVRREFAPAVDFVKWDLERRAARRERANSSERLNVLIGDGYHPSPIPGLVRFAVTEEILRAGGRFDKPVLVVEEASNYAAEVDRYHADLKAGDRRTLAEATVTLREMAVEPLHGAEAELHASGVVELIGMSLRGVDFLSPDPRSNEALGIEYTKQEEAVRAAARKAGRNVAGGCYDQMVDVRRALMTPGERAALESWGRKASRGTFGGADGLRSLAEVDRIIAERILNDPRYKDRTDATLVVMYGAGHFQKHRDLDEHIPGTVLNVQPTKAAEDIARLAALNDPGMHSDFPTAVWRHAATEPGDRLLILDMEALKAWHKDKYGNVLSDGEAKARVRVGKAKYLGLTDAQLGRWEIAAGLAPATSEQDRENAKAEMKALLEPTPEQRLACEPQVKAAAEVLRRELEAMRREVSPFDGGPVGPAHPRTSESPGIRPSIGRE